MSSPPLFSHFDADGQSVMVDVGGKPVTRRVAIAKSRIQMSSSTATAIRERSLSKGDVLEVARLAGIQAAKKTADLIPLCHLLPLEKVRLESVWTEPTSLEWSAEVQTTAKTGVEMEALVAASIAALTVYDMCKSIDQAMEVTHIGLWMKDGGARGRFERIPSERTQS